MRGDRAALMRGRHVGSVFAHGWHVGSVLAHGWHVRSVLAHGPWSENR